MSRLVVIGVVSSALVTGAVGYLLTRESERPPQIDISYGDIAKVQAYPVPEGTPPPPLLRDTSNGLPGTPLATVRSYIPSPFPAPVRCRYSGIGDGLQLSVWLRDGRRLDYLACAFPGDLKPLYDHAWG